MSSLKRGHQGDLEEEREVKKLREDKEVNGAEKGEQEKLDVKKPQDAATNKNYEVCKPSNEIVFATGNQKKLLEVKAILSAGEEVPFNIVAKKIDLPELQGDPEDIAKEKAKIASEQMKGGVLVEDTCLCYNALKGLPGPYIKWFLDKTGHEGLVKLLEGYEDKSGYAQCTFAYCEGPGAEAHVFVGKTNGLIVPPRGPPDFGWDPIFLPEGYDETYAEMKNEEKNKISHRYRALQLVKEFLLEKFSKKDSDKQQE
eukprot:TRINITY_DN14793_c1_g4_i1.p2 TRINITY_DN14793_c1_g4~~TRINITY_DN14793_c1_g4_i1.p2  ORF type:complete len:256 (+),score=60.45 TRINITY_DN14793_c1_g4_i1:67-834(+)